MNSRYVSLIENASNPLLVSERGQEDSKEALSRPSKTVDMRELQTIGSGWANTAHPTGPVF